VTARKPRKSLRRHAASVATLLGAVVAVLALPAPAGAVLAEVQGHGYGITPLKGVEANRLPAVQRALSKLRTSAQRRAHPFDGPPKGGGALLYNGGPVVHENTTHVIYWDPNKEFSATTKGIVEKFFTDVAHDSGAGTNVFGVNGQYTDKSGNAAYKSAFGGAVVDSNAYPSSACEAPTEIDPGPYSHCLMDEQLQSQLKTFIAAEGLPKGPTQMYFLLLPHPVATCLEEEGFTFCSSNFFCAYHSYIEPGTSNEIIYSDIPFSLLDEHEIAPKFFDAKGCQDDGNEAIQQPNPDNGKKENSETRFADVAVKYISHEYSEAQTDPLPGFSTAWLDANGLETGDKCNGVSADEAKDGVGYDAKAFLPVLGGEAKTENLYDQLINADHFYIQSEWDNVAKACRMSPLAITSPSFTSSPAAPVEFSPVKFKGSATDPYEHPEFKWDFGDASEGTGAEPEHTYFSEGKFEVTMTVKDTRTGSTAAAVKHTITVDETPLVFFTVEPLPVTVKANAKFDGKESEDPDGSITKFKWNFGDGTKVEGTKAEAEKVEHKYKEPGEYNVSLVVEDSSKVTAEEVEEVIVIDQPTVKTEPAAPVGQTTATLNAIVNPNGSFVSECKLEYGKTSAYGKEAPCSPTPGSEFEPVAVSAAVSGLEPATEYHYRVVAKNEVPEQSKGLDKTFTTLAKLAPVIAAESASAITLSTATLKATVNPNGAEVTECKFEYGTSESYGSSAPCATLPGEGTSPVGVSASISGLAFGTTYHFRLVATSAGGKGEGTDATFKTATPLPPAVASEAASAITQTTATLGATVNPNSVAVEECKVEYGTSVFYEATVPCAALPGSGSSPVAVSASIGGLAVNTTYHFRFVAKSIGGKTEGVDATFKTAEEAVKKPAPNSSFVAKAAANPKSGAITLVVSVVQPGTFTWLATFANGKFGVFSSSACKTGFVKLAGKCKPAKITFAKGSATFAAAGSFTLTLKPSASARRALATALKRRKGLVVTLALKYQSSLGGSPAAASLSLTDKLKKKK
jgi:PKD domain